MSASELQYDQLQGALLAQIPELLEPIERTFGKDYDLKMESPGAYPIFEDVVLDFLLKNLDSYQNGDLIIRLFDFFEKMANSSDGNVTDLLRVAILESLVYRPEYYQRAKQYLGKKTAEFAELESRTNHP